MERDLLKEIKQFCRRTGVAETTFGRLSVNDGKLVGRLGRGGTIRPKTRVRIGKFLRDQAPSGARSKSQPAE